MKIKHTFTLFCVTLTLAFLLVSCADTSGGGGDTTEKQFSNVSAESCKDTTLELNCFISVWNTANSGEGGSDSTNVVLPLVSDGTYDFYVDWGDDTGVEKITTASAATHEYATPGEYTIHIAGEIKGWRFFANFIDFGDAAKLLNVKQWGSLSLGNTAGWQFYNAENFNPTATDAPDLSETTDLGYAFANAIKFNAEIGNWDVSQITNMRSMFEQASIFNNGGKKLEWGDKTSNVTTMHSMFKEATSFDQDINEWDVGEVTDMMSMFSFAGSFNNGDMSLAWEGKTSKVTNMFKMFEHAAAFNIDISAWDVENVTSYEGFDTGSGLDLNNIPFKFREIDTISKEICADNPRSNCFISVWNTANEGLGASDANTIVLPLVEDGTYNFYIDWGDESDVQKIEAYDADAITHTYNTEDAADEKTIHIAGTIKGWRFHVDNGNYGDAVKLLNVTKWGSLSLGNTAGRQFQNAENFNPTATDAPDLSETTDLSYAFDRASNFNAPVGNWDVSKVTNTTYMFSEAPSFNNGDVELNWGDKTSNITDMGYMFFGAFNFDQDIGGWNVSKVTNMTGMFNTAIIFNQDISGWNVGEVTSMNGMFFTTDFNNGGKALTWGNKTSKVTNMGYMFFEAEAFNQDISAWDVRQVTAMGNMFSSATKFNNNGVALNWGDKTSNVADMIFMFFAASSFDQDISGWDVGEVTNMNSMFKQATSFNNGDEELDWGDKTSKVTDMQEMFSGAAAFNIDISAWDVEKVTKYDNFAENSGLELNNIPFKFRGLDTISKAICDANPLTNCFISTWNTTNFPTDQDITGFSGTMSVKLPLVSEGTYDFYVDWGDGEDVEKIEAYNAPEVTHTYTTPGEKTIHIAGTIKGWRFFAADKSFGDAVKLTDVSQWGSLSLGNTDGRQFQGAENFNPTATDAPDVSETTSLHSAFSGASNFNGEIGNWDVSTITTMSFMFWSASNFNNNGKPLDWGIKTSEVTDMFGMFSDASAFNQDTSGWNVAKVTRYDFFATGSGIENKAEYQPEFKPQ